MSLTDSLDNFKVDVEIGDRYFYIKRDYDVFKVCMYKVIKILNTRSYKHVKCKLVPTRELLFKLGSNGKYYIWGDKNLYDECNDEYYFKTGFCCFTFYIGRILNSTDIDIRYDDDRFTISKGWNFDVVYGSGNASSLNEEGLITKYVNNFITSLNT